MLSTPFSPLSMLRAMVTAAGLAALAACAPTSGAGVSSDGVAVDPNQPVRVGLLVPQGSGDPGRENLARGLINAAQLAQADLRNATLDVVTYPTGGTVEGGNAAASRAINDGAKILVGPLFSTATAGAQSIADQANIKMLSLSNNPEVAGGNTYIVGNTFLSSADRLVQYGLSRGLRNFAVVYPQGVEGETARNAVLSATRARGADVVASESYSVSVAGIESAAGPAAAALNATGANAIILTDGPTGGLVFMADALRSNGVSEIQAQYLGMQQWDASPEALAEPSLQGGVFVAPDPGLIAQFEGRYRNAYGESPPPVAVVAYDAIAAVGALVAEARSAGGSPFSDARITQSSGFAGAGGAFRFLPGGLNQRSLAVIEVRGGQAIVTERAAQGFAAFGN